MSNPYDLSIKPYFLMFDGSKASSHSTSDVTIHAKSLREARTLLTVQRAGIDLPATKELIPGVENMTVREIKHYIYVMVHKARVAKKHVVNDAEMREKQRGRILKKSIQAGNVIPADVLSDALDAIKKL